MASAMALASDGSAKTMPSFLGVIISAAPQLRLVMIGRPEAKAYKLAFPKGS